MAKKTTPPKPDEAWVEPDLATAPAYVTDPAARAEIERRMNEAKKLPPPEPILSFDMLRLPPAAISSDVNLGAEFALTVLSSALARLSVETGRMALPAWVNRSSLTLMAVRILVTTMTEDAAELRQSVDRHGEALEPQLVQFALQQAYGKIMDERNMFSPEER